MRNLSSYTWNYIAPSLSKPNCVLFEKLFAISTLDDRYSHTNEDGEKYVFNPFAVNLLIFNFVYNLWEGTDNPKIFAPDVPYPGVSEI